MSRHWNPDDDRSRLRSAGPRARWPEGATAGLAMVATVCVGLAILLYKVAAPRDVFGG